MRIQFMLLSFFFSVFAAVSAQNQSSIYPVALTCEYLDHPTGLDIKQPRFSWKLAPADASAFAQKQTAYRIMVSSAKDQPGKNKADIWNSGWVLSGESHLIPYKGKALLSDKDYYWTVSVKDENGTVSSLSETACFSTGLFDQKEWTAKWIGTNEVYDPYKGSNTIADPWMR
ncbi:MAG TPA: hypothetical protein PLL71_10650, partial [Agriterribacter sp.]|nr:hypothetical protein [Agriterribacter sp.]